jgi:putative transposase
MRRFIAIEFAGGLSVLHRKKLRRFETGSVRFLTFSCHDRLPLLQSERAKEIFLQHLSHAVDSGQCWLHAYVLMPEHVHLLLTPCEGQTVTSILKPLKRRTSLKLNALLDRPPPFWLAGGGYDRNIDTRDEYAAKVGYIHSNPVARHLVEVSQDWRFSSFCAYADLPYDGPRIAFVDTDFRW